MVSTRGRHLRSQMPKTRSEAPSTARGKPQPGRAQDRDQATWLCRLHHHNVRHTAKAAATAVRRQTVKALAAPRLQTLGRHMTHRTIQQLFDLKGKTALVTGGSRGLGLQLATRWAGRCQRSASARARRLTWKRPLPS